MTQEEIATIQSTWRIVSADAHTFSKRFYANLFQADPKLQSLFKRNMEAQGEKLMRMFNLIVEQMEHSEKIVPELVESGRRHIQYGVQPRDYEAMRQAFMQTLSELLGEERFRGATRLAWELAYNGIQTIMKSAGYQKSTDHV